MSSNAGGSRWADTVEDAAIDAKRRKEKEEKKRLKAEKARKLEEDRRARQAQEEAAAAAAAVAAAAAGDNHEDRPSKRRKLSLSGRGEDAAGEQPRPPSSSGAAAVSSAAGPEPARLQRFESPGWATCREISKFEKLNDIEEGTYGYVSRARELATGKVVALKRLKIEPGDQQGFPVTALREIKVLQNCSHRNIVGLQEIVTGKDANKQPVVFLVLEFVEHDLRTILDTQPDPFAPSETKQLLLQLARGVEYLHAHYVLHRDLKTSNLLLSNRGLLKIADFGMARYVGDPPPPRLTTLVVTLWYRAPELLLGARHYGNPIDMWSVGCIFGELLERAALFRGRNEVDQITKIFAALGVPTAESWPAFRTLPNAKALKLPPSQQQQHHQQKKSGPAAAAADDDAIRLRFPDLGTAGCALMRHLLSLDPARRPSASDMLRHAYFEEKPRPKAESLFPTFPSKANQERRPRLEPHAPIRGKAAELDEVDCTHLFGGRDSEAKGVGFRLRMGG